MVLQNYGNITGLGDGQNSSRGLPAELGANEGGNLMNDANEYLNNEKLNQSKQSQNLHTPSAKKEKAEVEAT